MDAAALALFDIIIYGNKRINDECLSCTYAADEFRVISFYVAKAYLLERERRSFAR